MSFGPCVKMDVLSSTCCAEQEQRAGSCFLKTDRLKVKLPQFTEVIHQVLLILAASWQYRLLGRLHFVSTL